MPGADLGTWDGTEDRDKSPLCSLQYIGHGLYFLGVFHSRLHSVRHLVVHE